MGNRHSLGAPNYLLDVRIETIQTISINQLQFTIHTIWTIPTLIGAVSQFPFHSDLPKNGKNKIISRAKVSIASTTKHRETGNGTTWLHNWLGSRSRWGLAVQKVVFEKFSIHVLNDNRVHWVERGQSRVGEFCFWGEHICGQWGHLWRSMGSWRGWCGLQVGNILSSFIWGGMQKQGLRKFISSRTIGPQHRLGQGQLSIFLGGLLCFRAQLSVDQFSSNPKFGHWEGRSQPRFNGGVAKGHTWILLCFIIKVTGLQHRHSQSGFKVWKPSKRDTIWV